ncbi:MAG: response regulator transcription factor [Bacteroidia bacterium]|nr:response regulator transcription factor [Bacteroidia bacterium]
MKVAIIAEPILLLSDAIAQKIRLSIDADKVLQTHDLSKKLVSGDSLLIVDQDHEQVEPFLIRHQHHPGCHVLVTGNELKAGLLQTLLGLGAKGYLCKSATHEEWEKAIREVSKGNRYLPASLQQQLKQHWFDNMTKGMEPDVSLTQREIEVLELIVAGYRSREIADKLSIGNCTVETHRINLMQKLAVQNTAGLVREAFLQHLLPSYHGKHGEKHPVFH